MPEPRFALVDGNSFFASCEQVFRPDLTDKPVIVLSNNDGCVVACTKEAKALGIKRGTPLFQIEELCAKNHVAIFSSNYELYGDLSGRMMAAIASFVDKIEPYSIDECFANMTGMESLGIDLTDLGRQIKAAVYKWVGIPTCVGIAPTKTLAKYCNHLAKKYSGLKGVCNWLDLTEQRQRNALKCQPVSEIWGVGRRYAARLNEMGIETALDLADSDPEKIRKLFGKPLAMTVLELQGESCMPLELATAQRKQIMRSRSFGNLVGDKESLMGAISYHASECGRILRQEKTKAHVVGIVLETNPFRENDPQYHVFPATGTPYPINDTKTILETALRLLNVYYRNGYLYKRAGVYVSEVVPEKEVTHDLFEAEDSEKRQKLSEVMDKINTRYGKGTICYASSKLGEENWVMKRFHLSPCYTTRWSDIPVIG